MYQTYKLVSLSNVHLTNNSFDHLSTTSFRAHSDLAFSYVIKTIENNGTEMYGKCKCTDKQTLIVNEHSVYSQTRLIRPI